MKKSAIVFFAAIIAASTTSCNSNEQTETAATPVSTEQTQTGQSGVQDDISQKNVVQVAIGSKDHSTLVSAIKQAELVDALSNAGPFTVFAPINDAFDKLPAGTVDDLMKNENKEKLTDILQYHVFVGVLKEDMMQDGQSIGQVNGANITISKSGSDILINKSAKILASVPASNGIIYVIDGVLLPQ